MITRPSMMAGFAASFLISGSVLATERTVTLAVDKMTCASCPYIVKQSLAKIPGVTDVIVSFKDKTATVSFEDTVTTTAALTGATTDSGFPSRLAKGGNRK